MPHRAPRGPHPLKLVLANKAYSSWSLRPWLLMRVLGIAFDEVVIPLDQPDTAQIILGYSPAGKLPVLLDGPARAPLRVWESLAIIDHLAAEHPEQAIWPPDRAARALARSLAAEMHAGFAPLRRALPMNMRRAPRPPASRDDATARAVALDIARIEAAWADARARFGHGSGPFLFGAFGAADAMFAPVVNRLHAYAQPVSPATRAYMEAVMALPAWRDWQTAATAEGWRLARIDDV